MKQKKRQNFLKRGICFLLAFVLCVSGMNFGPGTGKTAKAAQGVISITSAQELAKIGRDAAYPMDGDYVLAEDIDLSGINWTPIGGSGGEQYGLVTGSRVFCGTFDGRGHVISNLTIEVNGSTSGHSRNQSGLFAMIGSDSASDYAEVRNINFTDVSITHTLGGGDTIGALSGDVNGYVKIDNIAVLSGGISVNGNNGGDLIGMGGITGQVRTNGSAVQMSNLYNAASVTAESNVPTSWVRCGGILGRIHQDAVIGMLSSCLNVGTVLYKGSEGYAVNGNSNSVSAAANTTNITDCYYLKGSGIDFGASTEISEAQMGSQEIADALGADCWGVSNGRILPLISQGKIVTPIPSPVFAEGDKASAVTKNFTLPLAYVSEEGEEAISWTSSNPEIISVNGAEAMVFPVISDTQVTLTAETSVSGKTKSVIVTVRSNLTLKLDQEYGKPGTQMRAYVENAPEGTEFTYVWKVNGNTVSTSDKYTPTQANLNNFITVTASLADSGAKVDDYKFYFSKLPVVYIDTNDGFGITSKTEYKDANMRIQGNDKFNSQNSTLYDGAISIRGRGNSTWNTGFNKLPYKIKLDSKTDLMGFGVSKHWALLANYMDESLIRNTTSYNLSGTMGMNYLKSTHVEVILNGVYAGNYQLVGNVRIEESRVNIYDWEDAAGDVAKAIGKAEGIKGDARDELEDYLNEHMEWITSDSATWKGKTYKISDYFTDLPKDAEGNIDLSGGFLFELDDYYDEISKFRTNSNQPIMFKSPEFAYTNTALFASAQNYIQAVENSIHSADFYTTYQNETKHYTDLVDMDSLVRYFVLNEFFWNTETMKKSTYMYKDLGEKLYIGPVWDMDWTSNSIVSQGETSNYSVWMTTTAAQNAQKDQWYRYLIGDPYFVTKVYECYQENRQNFEDIVKSGGIIDQQKEYLGESAEANYEAGYLQHRSTFETETERLRTFLKNRLGWLDGQFTSVNNLLSSFGKFKASSNISVTADTSDAVSTTYTATLKNISAAKAGFYINGILAGTANVSGGKAVFTAEDTLLEKKEGALNIVQVRAMDASGNLLSNGRITNYAAFEKELYAETLTGNVTISGAAKTGSVLTAVVSDTNNTGTLSYQWMADGADIAGAVSESYMLTDEEIGKVITVRVTSSAEAGSLVSAATEAVTRDEVKNDHIIINQVYGGGNNDGTPVSHSFIELYNPTEKEVNLGSYTLGYLSGGKNGPAAEEARLPLSGTLPAHTSYLVRCEAQDTSTPELIKLQIEVFDQEWSQIIDNKQYRIILYNGSTQEDGVSVNEGNVEGMALPDGTISKQKAIRRNNFADTNNNQADFAVVEYKGADTQKVEENRPRSLEDGAWGESGPIDPPGPEKLSGTISIRGNAIVGAILYADENTNNSGELSYQWLADGRTIAGENGMFLVLDNDYLGQRISVRIESTVESGKLESDQTGAVVKVEAQREHVIINQVYGGGQTSKGGAPVSHSFIELYNPTAESVNLDEYNILYHSGETEEVLLLSGEIPACSSYLIQCAKENKNEDKLVYTITNPDITWDQVIDNKRYSVVLRKGIERVDGVSVNEAFVEGEPLTNPENDEIISKNKAVRRIQFIDTDQNTADFEVLNYSKVTPMILEMVTPRGTADGSWGLENPVNPRTEFTVTFQANDKITKVVVEKGQTVSQPENPERTGYRFTGWYRAGQLFDFDTPILADTALSAGWEKMDFPDIEKKDYEVTFEVDGTYTIVKVKEGSTVEPLEVPVKAGYEFAGWYRDGVPYDFSAKVTESFHLTAVWTKTAVPEKAPAAPVVKAVKSILGKNGSRVKITVNKVSGAEAYHIYRRRGGKTVFLGSTANGTFYDDAVLSGKTQYLAKAVKGTLSSGFGKAKAITLPKATKKVTAKAGKGKRTVSISWKRVKGATGYALFRSEKKNSGYKRIAILKKASKLSYTDKKVKKGKTYYYRVVTVKKKLYGPAKTSKAVKIKK